MKCNRVTVLINIFIIFSLLIFVSFNNVLAQNKLKKIKAKNFVVYEPPKKKANGKRILFLVSDHEYRSEQTIPAIARIMSYHHGFQSVVVLGLDREGRYILPGGKVLPGLKYLSSSDLLVIFTRWLHTADKNMQMIVEYLESGKPVVGLRTSTHAFKYRGKNELFKSLFSQRGEKKIPHPSLKISTWYTNTNYYGGFGRQVLGESWAGHYGENHKQLTKIELINKDHPVVKGISGFMYLRAGGYYSDPEKDSIIIGMAQPLVSMKKDASPDANKPAVPGIWIRNQYKAPSGKIKKARVFTTQYGASEDILDDNFRRILVNGIFWSIGLENQIKSDLTIDFVGGYKPDKFDMNKNYRIGVKPSDIKSYKSDVVPQNAKLLQRKIKK